MQILIYLKLQLILSLNLKLMENISKNEVTYTEFVWDLPNHLTDLGRENIQSFKWSVKLWLALFEKTESWSLPVLKWTEYRPDPGIKQRQLRGLCSQV